MTILNLRFSLVSVVILGGLAVAACGDGATADAGSGGTSSGGTGTGTGTGGSVVGSGGTAVGAGGTTAGTGGSTGQYDTTCTAVACGTTALIDDFADGDTAIADGNGTVGYWSSWVDPAALGASVTAPDAAITEGKIEVTATGLTGSDGANFGAGLNNLSTVNCGLDAHLFDGVSIVGKTLAASAETVLLRAVMPDVVPIADGGLCPATDQCWGTHSVEVVFEPVSGTVLKTNGQPVVWTDLEQPDWATPVVFDPARIITVEIANKPNTDGFHLEITSIGFSGAGGGMGGASSCE